MREKLREPFPPEAYQAYDSKPFLTVLKAMYVIERLNDVFGLGKWNLEHKVIKEDNVYVLIRGQLKLLNYPDMIIPAQYGGHKTGGAGTEMADGYKSAITDCISKSASYLEIGIDVFKGLIKPPKSIKKEPEKSEKKSQGFSDLPWLNQKTKEWDIAVKELQEEKTTISKLKAKYKFSKLNEKELEKQCVKSTEKPKQESAKTELLPAEETDSPWQQAIIFMKGGGTIFEIKKKYDISEENCKTLAFESINNE